MERGHPDRDDLLARGHEAADAEAGDARFGVVTAAGTWGAPSALADWRRMTWAGVASGAPCPGPAARRAAVPAWTATQSRRSPRWTKSSTPEASPGWTLGRSCGPAPIDRWAGPGGPVTHLAPLDFAWLGKFCLPLPWASWTPLWPSALGFAIAMPAGLVLAAGRTRGRWWPSQPIMAVVDVARFTPLLVRVVWLHFALPACTGRPLPANVSAYVREILCAGIVPTPPGQWEAARAMALPARVTWTRVVIPQATRLALPPFVNFLTELLKGTTLLATIGVADLALKAYVLGAQTFRYLEFLTAIAIIYFVIIFPVARLAEWMEHRLAAATR